MKAEELRIGNYVDLHGKMVKIMAIDYREEEYYLKIKGVHPAYWIDEFKPIPLTEELLLKCGFMGSRNDHGNTFHIIEEDGFTVKFTIEHWTKAESKEYKNRFHADKVGKIEALHQLQNVLFVLYGKELEVKL